MEDFNKKKDFSHSNESHEDNYLQDVNRRMNNKLRTGIVPKDILSVYYQDGGDSD